MRKFVVHFLRVFTFHASMVSRARIVHIKQHQ